MINQRSAILSDIEIFVDDGQNRSQIQTYIHLDNTNNWDPCIPMTFSNEYKITINFNANHIKNLIDWYPAEICNNDKNGMSYTNEYLFDGGKSLTINNLTINNYFLSDNHSGNYPFIRSIDYYDASITCNDCSFINISSKDQPLFNSMASIYLYNNTFNHVTTSQDIIYAHHDDLDAATREFKIERTTFSHITANSILEAGDSQNDVR